MTHYQKSKVFLHLATLLCAVGSISGECEISQCSDPSTCVLSQRRTCKCAVGYFGDLCDQVATMNVTCGKDFISILVDEEFFKYYNVGIEAVHLTNASCRAHREEISGSAYFTVHTPMDQYTACGGKPLEKNITHIVYSLTLMSDPPIYGNIVRDPVVQIEYKCIYPYIRRLSLAFPIISFSSERMFKVDEVDAKVEMSLFKDHTYKEAFTSAPTIKLGDQIYVQIQVTEPEDFFHLKVNECWVTQTPQANKSGFSHTLLVNGYFVFGELVTEGAQMTKRLHLVMVRHTLQEEMVRGRLSVIRLICFGLYTSPTVSTCTALFISAHLRMENLVFLNVKLYPKERWLWMSRLEACCLMDQSDESYQSDL
uniref:Pancreatic secretory granule membrane major glycoprotein GP2-like n=1 Tax=Sinocyclocheilus rhinocerous TaxID=307959 RepID=A0A673MZC4_9TELE